LIFSLMTRITRRLHASAANTCVISPRQQQRTRYGRPTGRYIARLLLWAANQISEKQPRGPGAARKFDHGAAAMKFAYLVVHEGVGKKRARQMLADEFQVVITAMEKALAPYEAAALRFEGGATKKRK
jgi:hypothetical protein